MRNETLDFRDSMNHRISNNTEAETQIKAPEYPQRVWRKLNKCTGPEDYKEVLKEYRDRVKRWSKKKLNLNK
jgi:hypothetical protein